MSTQARDREQGTNNDSALYNTDYTVRHKQGIDYGSGKTNIDIENGIRYGIIPQNEVLQAWCDESKPVYPCNECKLTEKEKENNNGECDCCEPLYFEINDSKYHAFIDESGDIMVLKAPYYTYAQFCSPCAPGACYLMNPVEKDSNNKCYCFGHDWFDDGKAPYTVYDINTNKVI